MTETIKHTAAAGTKQGLKARAADLLKARADSDDPEVARSSLSLGEIGSALGLPKTDHPALSAVLVKLRNQGQVLFETGAATSGLGPRFVKRYRWKKRTPKATIKPADKSVDDRRYLSLCR